MNLPLKKQMPDHYHSSLEPIAPGAVPVCRKDRDFVTGVVRKSLYPAVASSRHLLGQTNPRNLLKNQHLCFDRPIKKIKSSEPLTEPSGERIEPWVTVRQEPEIPCGQEPVLSSDVLAASVPDAFGETDYDFGGSRPVIFDSREPESLPPPKKPPVPLLSPPGTGSEPGKKTLIGIIAVIIIIAVLVGGFFLFPMITNSAETPHSSGSSITPLPTIVKNSASAVTLAKTLKPTIKPTSPGGPGNSPANAGF